MLETELTKVTISLLYFQNRIETKDSAIANYKKQIAMVQESKKGLVKSQKLQDKLLALVDVVLEDFKQYASAIDSLKDIIDSKFETAVKKEEKIEYTAEQVARFEEDIARPGVYELEEELIDRSQVAPDSNELFSWQPTSNPAIAQYFNVLQGVPQATYLACNNKNRLIGLEDKLTNWLPGLSCSVRKAKRMDGYTYELKVRNINDDDLGWLTQLDLSQNLNDQLSLNFWKHQESDPDYRHRYSEEELKGQHFELCCSIAATEVGEIEPVSPDLPELPDLAIVTTKRASQTKIYQVLFTEGDKVKVIDLEDPNNRRRSILIRNLDRLYDLPTQYKFWLKDYKEPLCIDWQELAIYYRRELKNCKSKEDFTELKKDASCFVTHNNIDHLEVLKWTYNRLPVAEKTRIDDLCEKKVA